MRIIAGPCQHESLEHSMKIATECKRVCDLHSVEYVFKASFDKANRSSMQGKRGVGLATTMEDFIVIKDNFTSTEKTGKSHLILVDLET